MEFSADALSVDLRYKLLTGTVVPRPIAVVSSCSPEGAVNLAPFSYFNIVGHFPMALSFSVAGPKPDRADKDTLRNVRPVAAGGTGEFVIHIASAHWATQMARTAVPVPYGASEFDLAGLTPVPSRTVAPPRVAEALVAFECRTVQVVEVGRSSLVIGEVLHLYIQDDLLNERMRIDADRLAAIGRMAGSAYCRTTDRFAVEDERFFPGSR